VCTASGTCQASADGTSCGTCRACFQGSCVNAAQGTRCGADGHVCDGAGNCACALPCGSACCPYSSEACCETLGGSVCCPVQCDVLETGGIFCPV
jgi:hypothetical protein